MNAILYSSENPALDRTPVLKAYGGITYRVFIRVQLCRINDLADALGRANPRKDEIILNTIEVKPCGNKEGKP